MAPPDPPLKLTPPSTTRVEENVFSPTDLVATALGSCMMTIMGIYAQRNEIDIIGTKVRVEKHMTSEAPRRISRIVTEITVPLPEDHPQRRAMEKAAVACPVHLSLHPNIEKDVTFLWVGVISIAQEKKV